MLERDYQAKLIKKIKALWPGCIVLKNDPNYIQGFPDLTIMYKDRWATLEVKNSEHAPHRPNQDSYVEMTNSMSFSRFIFPENETEVLHELGEHFRRNDTSAIQVARTLRKRTRSRVSIPE